MKNEQSHTTGTTHLTQPKDKNNLTDLLESSMIDPKEEISEPPICLSIIPDLNESIIGTLGNYSMVIGKAKSRKTFLVSIMLAAMKRNSIVLNQFCGKLPEGKEKVFFFDTEQSRFHVQRVYKRVCRLAGNTPKETFVAFCLRKFSPPERLEMIEHAIYSTPDLGFVVIDGIRDLLTSINDEEQATMMASKLLKWTEERGIHIVCVLHQNKNDTNARGHLGTELQNKAETVLSVTKDSENKNYSIVEADFCRDIEPEPFAFEIDGEGLPKLIEHWKTIKEGQRTKKSIVPQDFDLIFHHRILNTVFKVNKELKRPDLMSNIKMSFADENISIGDNKTRDFVTYYLSKELIKKHGTDGSPKAFYTQIIEVC